MKTLEFCCRDLMLKGQMKVNRKVSIWLTEFIFRSMAIQAQISLFQKKMKEILIIWGIIILNLPNSLFHSRTHYFIIIDLSYQQCYAVFIEQLSFTPCFFSPRPVPIVTAREVRSPVNPQSAGRTGQPSLFSLLRRWTISMF